MRKHWVKILILIPAMTLLSGCTLLGRKQVAGLQVITDEVSSSLFLDGQYLDKTAFIDQAIKPGQYTLRIEPDKAELAPYETQVTLRQGLLTVVTWKPGQNPETSSGVIYEMEPIKSNQGELSFVTVPDNAIVKLDSGGQQFSPLTITNLEPGHHQFEISLPSYEKQAHTINVVKGHRTTVTVKLAKITPTETNASLEPSPAATQAAQLNTAPTVKILATGYFQDGVEVLRVRSQATTAAATIDFAHVGESYPYLEEKQGEWLKIKLDNQIGWISGDYVETATE